MKIKNKIVTSWNRYIVVALLCAVALCMSPPPTQAQSGQSLNFINGYNLQITTLTTNTYSGTNSYSKGFTQTNSGTYPYVSSFSPIWFTNTQAFSDATLWCDRDGTTPSLNIAVDVNGLNAIFTNTVTFNFATIAYNVESGQGVAALPTTSANGLFSFSITGNGTNDVVLQTNVPSAFLQGARRLRLLSVGVSTGTGTGGTNGTVVGVWLDGYKPVGQE